MWGGRGTVVVPRAVECRSALATVYCVCHNIYISRCILPLPLPLPRSIIMKWTFDVIVFWGMGVRAQASAPFFFLFRLPLTYNIHVL